MNKKNILTGVLVALVLVAGIVFIILAPKKAFNVSQREIVSVSGGVATPAEREVNFYIEKDGKYMVHAFVSGEYAPGFITVAEVYDRKGQEVLIITGAGIESESAPVELKAGDYRCRFINLTDAKSYKDYVASHTNLKDVAAIDDREFKNGEWVLDYNVEVNSYVVGTSYRNGLIVGLIVGLLLVGLLILVIRDPNAPVKEYDERQVAAKGKAYKYGFYAFLVWFSLAIFAEEMDVVIPASKSVIMFLGLLVSAGVMVTVSVMNDAYFRMDEKRGTFIGVFSGIAVMNILLGASHITRGDIFVDGKLTFVGSANFICGIFVVYLLIILLIKYLLDKKEE
ncbi:MAG: hypothetical protein J6113_06285 [Lachnospiraceae bacterium]|nr:hypothetical protein [Lachnospiraceae bacterium]